MRNKMADDEWGKGSRHSTQGAVVSTHNWCLAQSPFDFFCACVPPSPSAPLLCLLFLLFLRFLLFSPIVGALSK
eukprot:m.171353 g.171353  ORF g.171353 m.171353 type:complete len:74 (+) comp24231_c0_seq1:32-253(+)